MRIIIKKYKWIGIVLVFLLASYYTYPLFIRWIAGYYSKQFSIVLNSHDMNEYDKFFCDDTIFEWNGNSISYLEARSNIEKMQDFSSIGSYGYLKENTNVYDNTEYVVRLILPIENYSSGDNVGLLEGWFILRREGIFFRIVQVTFYEDKAGFLKQFLIGKNM